MELTSSSTAQNKGIRNIWIFPVLWVVTLAIYIPAGNAGWVIDAAGWIYDMKANTFWGFLNRIQSGSQSLYQLFALHYYVFYKIWGLNPWLWSVLYITVHAINAYLLFVLCKRLFDDAGLRNSFMTAFAGAAIFCACPHVSEVIVWKATSHYLQGLAFILLIMVWIQKYMHTQKKKYAWYAAVVFILSAFGLEIFYLIPFFSLSLAVFYRTAFGFNKKVFTHTVKYFFIPQILLLIIYFISLYAAYKFLRPHKTEINEALTEYLAKPIKSIWHIVFLGRYFSMDVKKTVYSFCGSLPVLVTFYTLLLVIMTATVAKWNTLRNTTKVALLLLGWAMISLFFIMPLAFPGPELLVFYDRYTYFAAGFLYMMLSLIIGACTHNKYILTGIFCIYVDFNIYFTIKVNTYWMDSDKITRKLINTIPINNNKTVLLLNIPENMNGVPMVGAQPESEIRALKSVYDGITLPKNIYDVASYNMVESYNGAHVKVLNDSVISVILNHTGTWWWYEGHGALSYETPEYKVDMKKVGQRYDLTLKYPADKYLLLYTVGDTWKKVDMSKINVQQD